MTWHDEMTWADMARQIDRPRIAAEDDAPIPGFRGTAPPNVWPPDDVLRVRNEEILAERMRWPAGALKEVRLLRAAHPGWIITWASGGVGAWVEDGYYAWPASYTWPGRRYVHRSDPLQLSVVLDLAPHPLPDWTPPGGWLPI